MNQRKNIFYTYDLPEDLPVSSIAIDTEAMGLKLHRDRLCVVQIADENGNINIIHFPRPEFDKSPNLIKLLTDKSIEKIFHYGRFDIAILMYSFNISIENVFCTKIASYLSRTYTEKHGLSDLCKTFLGIKLEKIQQTSDWGQENLTGLQKKYAAGDVIYLHEIKQKLVSLLKRENRMELAQKCFEFLPHKCKLDIMAGEDFDVFAYKQGQ